MSRLLIQFILITALTASWAKAAVPAIWPVSIEFKDGAGNQIIPAAGLPFVLCITYKYSNPTASHYRIRWDCAGVTNYSGDIGWGAGAGAGTYVWVLAVWTSVDKAGSNNFTVKVDCDDQIVGASISAKSKAFPVTFMPRLNTYDFSGWDAFFRSKIPDDGAGGYVWAGMENGEVRAIGVGGYARSPWEPVSPGIRMTTNHPMILASVSKLLTRVGLAKLWELKRNTPQAFDYTNRVAPYLSGIISNIHPSFLTVTIGDLRNHTSGLTNNFGDIAGMQSVLSQPLAYPSGGQFFYLNGNYYLLATVMSVIAGEPYHDFMIENVFHPLGMWNTEDHPTESEPTMFYGPASLHRPGVLLISSGEKAGPGGWWSTIGDLALLMRSLRYSTLLEPATSIRDGFNTGVWAADGGITWIWNDTYGKLSTRVCRYNDSLDAILLINSDKGPAGALLDEAFQLPQPGLQLKACSATNKLRYSFLAQAGYSYTVQIAGSLSQSSWTNQMTVTGSNTIQTFELPFSEKQKFLRLKRN